MCGSSVGQFSMTNWRPSNSFLMSAVGMWVGWVKQEIHADGVGHLKISTVFAGYRTRNRQYCGSLPHAPLFVSK